MPSYSEVVLHATRYLVRRELSQEFGRTMTVEVLESFLRNSVIVTLKKDLLRHKLLEDVTFVPVTGKIKTTELPQSVMVEIPNGWWRRFWGLRTRKVWAPVIGNAAYADAPDVITVGGSARVRAEYFMAFPEATVAYPDSLGRGIPMIIPLWDPEPDDFWSGPDTW